jgi:hypothetical protein
MRATSMPAQTLMTEAVPAVEKAHSTAQQQQSQTSTSSLQREVEVLFFDEVEESSYSIKQSLDMLDF